MKDFDNWNIRKKKIEKNRWPYFKEWQIWNFSLWVNVWVESYWKWNDFARPVLVVKKFNNKMFFWIPLTTRNSWNKYIESIWNINWKESFLSISQLKIFSNKRLLNKISSLSKDDLLNIKQKIRDIF